MNNKLARYWRTLRYRRKIGFFKLLLPVLCLLALFLFLEKKAMPQLEQLATAQVSAFAHMAVNTAVEQQLERLDADYDQLVIFEKDNYGKIIALKSNMPLMNKLKAGISNQVLRELNSPGQLKIPMGNLLDVPFLAGRGPGIGVRIIPVSLVRVSFYNQFTSAGINQTNHRIIIDISIEIKALVPGIQTKTLVENQICLAESVIVGVVPDTYLQIGAGD